MILGDWIPMYLTSYKLNTVRPDSYYTLQMVAGKIPQHLQEMELRDVRPMHLQQFVNDFGLTASKSYMDKMHVMLMPRIGIRSSTRSVTGRSSRERYLFSIATPLSDRRKVNVRYVGTLVAQQTGDCIVRVDDAHDVLRQPCVLLRDVGVPKPMEGQTAVGILVADPVAVAVDEQL